MVASTIKWDWNDYLNNWSAKPMEADMEEPEPSQIYVGALIFALNKIYNSSGYTTPAIFYVHALQHSPYTFTVEYDSGPNCAPFKLPTPSTQLKEKIFEAIVSYIDGKCPEPSDIVFPEWGKVTFLFPDPKKASPKPEKTQLPNAIAQEQMLALKSAIIKHEAQYGYKIDIKVEPVEGYSHNFYTVLFKYTDPLSDQWYPYPAQGGSAAKEILEYTKDYTGVYSTHPSKLTFTPGHVKFVFGSLLEPFDDGPYEVEPVGKVTPKNFSTKSTNYFDSAEKNMIKKRLPKDYKVARIEGFGTLTVTLPARLHKPKASANKELTALSAIAKSVFGKNNVVVTKDTSHFLIRIVKK